MRVAAVRRHEHLLIVSGLLLVDLLVAQGVRLLGHRRLSLINVLKLVSMGGSLKEPLLLRLWPLLLARQLPILLDAVATGREVDLVVVRREAAVAEVGQQVVMLGAALLEGVVWDVRAIAPVC